MKTKWMIIGLIAAIAAKSIANTEAPAEKEGWTQLEIEYPKPLFLYTGRFRTIRPENLECKTVVPKILVPKGTKNLATDKAITSSDDFPPIGDLKYVNNGDKGRRNGSYVELGPGVQWVQIDLGTKKETFAIALWHSELTYPLVYRDVIVQVSDDADFKKNVRTIFNNDHDNSAGLGSGKDKEYIETASGKLVDAKGVKAQFVRLYSNGSTGSDMNHYIEVEVFGK